jgi:hypothetical protein
MRRIALGAALSLLLAAPVLGQGVRGDLRVDYGYIEYQTVRRVSVPEDQVPGSGNRRVLPDGTIAYCTSGECAWYESGDVVAAEPLVQDLRLTAWTGIQGLSARTHLRGRFGSDSRWPRSGQEFVALLLHVDYERSVFRLRAGRQSVDSGLGYYLFDGGSVRVRPRPWLRLEAFGGRSLARTLAQYRTGTLMTEVENLPPRHGSNLWAAQLGIRPRGGFSLSATYLTELVLGAPGRYSERFSVDTQWRNPGVVLDGSADYDLGYGQFNEFKLRARVPLGSAVDVAGQYRYYRPFLEYWTIWGAFSPIGYSEGRLAAFWNPGPRWTLSLDGAYRSYEDTSTESGFLDFRTDGWRTTAGIAWTDTRWSIGLYGGAEEGVGAAMGNLDLTVGYTFPQGHYLGIHTLGTLEDDEYRFGSGRTGGGGVDARLRLGSLRLDGSAGLFAHTYQDRPGFENYDQFRGRLALTYEIGSDPGLAMAPRGGAR